MPSNVWFSPQTLGTLLKQFESVSPSAWHKMFNPFCPQCVIERGTARLSAQIDQNAAKVASEDSAVEK